MNKSNWMKNFNLMKTRMAKLLKIKYYMMGNHANSFNFKRLFVWIYMKIWQNTWKYFKYSFYRANAFFGSILHKIYYLNKCSLMSFMLPIHETGWKVIFFYDFYNNNHKIVRKHMSLCKCILHMLEIFVQYYTYKLQCGNQCETILRFEYDFKLIVFFSS